MYFYYVDESGTEEKAKYLVVGGFLVGLRQWNELRDEIIQLKANCGLTATDPVKFSPYRGVQRKKVQELPGKLHEFRMKVCDLICRSPIELLAAVIDKDRLSNPYPTASKFIAQRFQYFLQDRSREDGVPCYGLPVFAATGRERYLPMMQLYQDCWFNGIKFRGIEPVFPDQLIDFMSIVWWKHSLGVQLADCCIGPLALYCEQGTTTYVSEIIHKFRTSHDTGEVLGYGIVLFPPDIAIDTDSLRAMAL